MADLDSKREGGRGAIVVALIGATGAVVAAIISQLPTLVKPGLEPHPRLVKSSAPEPSSLPAPPEPTDLPTQVLLRRDSVVSLPERVRLLRAVLGESASDPSARRNAVLELMKLSHEKMAELRNERILAADFTKAYSGRLNLRGTDFNGVDLRAAILNDVDLQGAALRDAKLSAMSMQRANLRWAKLERATCDRTDFRGAEFEGASLEDANLTRADLRRANLQKALGVTQVQVAHVCWDDQTRFPPEIEPSPPECPE